MRLPDGWSQCKNRDGVPNPYAIQRDDFTICRIADTYELWRGKEQLAVNLPSAQAAIDEWQKVSRGERAA